MGPFAKDYFSNFGKSTDFNRQLTRDYFFTANHHWLEVYHVDGFRYDCVPNYWDGSLGVGYAASSMKHTGSPNQDRPKPNLLESVRRRCRARHRLIQCAEQLEGPKKCCAQRFLTARGRTAPSMLPRRSRAAIAALADLGLSLGLFGYPEEENQRRRDSENRAAIHRESRSRTLHL